jgi:hypothetical protein
VAIEQAVFETVQEGERRGLWRYKQSRSTAGENPTADRK